MLLSSEEAGVRRKATIVQVGARACAHVPAGECDLYCQRVQHVPLKRVARAAFPLLHAELQT